jgi:hypothetical protein
MRTVLTLGLLIVLCASANAATTHPARLRHIIIGPSENVPAPRLAVPGWTDEQTQRWLNSASSSWTRG